LEHLFAVWPTITEKIHNARQVLFLSDYDGTLTPIVEKPELADLSESTRSLLQELTAQRHLSVGIISGRALVDLKEKVNIKGIVYAGNHGFEIEGPGLKFVNPIVDEMKPFFRVIRQVLVMTAGTIKGVLVEDKGITLSVHYRQADEEKAEYVQKLVKRAISGPASHGMFKMTSGKKVCEVRPKVNWDKGKAIRLLMKKYGRGGWNSGLLPFYMGDDLTDEDGFRVIEKYGNGVTIHVGEQYPGSVARYFLKSPDEVRYFLGMLLDFKKRGRLCEQYSTTSSPTGPQLPSL
jgi:trehalose 6-phosphate phosphatase